MDIEKRRAKGRKDSAAFRKRHPEANKIYRQKQEALAKLGSDALILFHWLNNKAKSDSVEGQIAEAEIRIKALDICGVSLKRILSLANEKSSVLGEK